MQLSKIFKILVRICICSLLLQSVQIQTATADSNSDCSKTCVDVYTDDNKLIISAQKGGQQTPRPSAKPKTSAKPTPKPIPKPTSKPIVKSSSKPLVKPKPIAKPGTTSAPTQSESLSDRLVKLLPTGNIKRQPTNEAVVNVPTIFWTNTPTKFNAVIPILDVVVIVNLYPTFNWQYGDGNTFTTLLPGAPYPISMIQHTYKTAGDYEVALSITWKGTYSVDGVTMPITGEAIKQIVKEDLTVVQALSRFNK
ncbi:MAG: hypothetical protein RLZZ378_495 [Actinomycetota bacterium]